MLKVWNMALIILTYALSIFGTFLAEWRDCFRACFRPIVAWSLFFALPRRDINCCYHFAGKASATAAQ